MAGNRGGTRTLTFFSGYLGVKTKNPIALHLSDLCVAAPCSASSFKYKTHECCQPTKEKALEPHACRRCSREDIGGGGELARWCGRRSGGQSCQRGSTTRRNSAQQHRQVEVDDDEGTHRTGTVLVTSDLLQTEIFVKI